MQPPLIQPFLRDAVRQLVDQASANARRNAYYPAESIIDEYTRQIAAWVQGLSPSQAMRPYTIGEVIALAGLQGHYRSRACARYAGEALRRSGFKPYRDWTAAGRNRRYWAKELVIWFSGVPFAKASVAAHLHVLVI